MSELLVEFYSEEIPSNLQSDVRKQINERLKDSVFQLNQRIDEQNDFSLEGNEYALRYFENLSIQNKIHLVHKGH